MTVLLKRISSVFLIGISSAVLVIPVLAQNADQNSLEGSFDFVDTIRGNAEVQDFGSPQAFILQVLRVFLSIVVVIAIAAIMWAGFVYITAAGDESRTKRAKSIILFAIVGLLVIGAAAIIVNLVIAIYAT